MYQRKLFPRQPEEDARSFVARLIRDVPNGYMNILANQHPDIIENIDQLDYPTRGERLFNWYHNFPKNECTECGNKCSFKQFSEGYYRFCSASCRARHNKSFLNGTTSVAQAKRKQWRENLTPEQSKHLYQNRKPRVVDNDKRLANREAKRKVKWGEDAILKLSNKQWMTHAICVEFLTSQQIASQLNVPTHLVLSYSNELDVEWPNAIQSKAEQQLANFVVSKGLDVQRNVRGIIPQFELDIYVPSKQIAIEFCGSYWHSPDNKLVSKSRNDPKYHQNKMKLAREAGINLITIFDYDWLTKPNAILARIESKLGIGQRIYARKCKVQQIDSKTANRFLNDHHFAGGCGSHIQLGLMHGDQLVAVGTFGKPRYSSTYQWEIIRFASLTGYMVCGGFSKIMKVFENICQPQSIISYADNCWGMGDVYKHSGFKNIGTTPPSYRYVSLKDPSKSFHRSTFMKHKVVAMGGDPTLTEVENMKRLGYIRVWDCGTTKWVKQSDR